MQDSTCIFDEICLKCWQTLQDFSEYCEKIRSIHLNLVEETNSTGGQKVDEQTDIIELSEGGENVIESYEYTKTSLLNIESDLGDEGDSYSRRSKYPNQAANKVNKIK